jgi:hypothetical protein
MGMKSLPRMAKSTEKSRIKVNPVQGGRNLGGGGQHDQLSRPGVA